MKLTLARAKAALRIVNVVLRGKVCGDYRVNILGGTEETAYYTPDLDDACQTGVVMAVHALSIAIANQPKDQHDYD